jgi:hypothetical protein
MVYLNAKLFQAAQSNARVFTVTEATTPFELSVLDVSLNSPHYNISSPVGCQIYVKNSGGEGSDVVEWQVIDSLNAILSSGTVNSGSVGWRSAALVSVPGITSPAVYSSFRVRARIVGDIDWIYSASAYALPVNLAITAVHPYNDVFFAGTPVQCSVNITNAGYGGSQVIEWQVVQWADNSIVISSGSHTSGTIGDFASTVVPLIGITSPVTVNTTARIRARIQGAAEWTYAGMPLMNYIPSAPENPTPRG